MTGGMMFKGTPGKWEYSGGGRVTTADDEIRFIAEAYVDEDAKLIAAAPELLQVVMRLANGERSDEGHTAIREAAIAAIAKALGEQK